VCHLACRTRQQLTLCGHPLHRRVAVSVGRKLFEAKKVSQFAIEKVDLLVQSL
jgi:hypothetical protein